MQTNYNNTKPAPDKIMVDIANYVYSYEIKSELAYKTSYYCLLDSIGCGLEALEYKACTNLLGHIIPDITVKNGVKVFGTNYQLDPVQAAFNIGAMIRWLDYNDTWLAKEWGHPSDNLGAILAVCDFVSRNNLTKNRQPLIIKDVLMAMIKAYEIQGVIALENSFNAVGLDHVVLVKLASTAVSCQLLGLSVEQTINAISLVFTDGQALRTYRHAPNTGSRKSWAAGDATSRGVKFALMAQAGEMGYPSALTAPKWGFYDVLFQGKAFVVNQPYGSYVMENILFKISYPAEFHSQTAVECAIKLHQHIKDKINDISQIIIRTHESAIRIIDKQGPLTNPADRDHCIQYMVAVAMIYGRLLASDYEDDIANNITIDELRAKIKCVEDINFTKDYLDPNKRSIANAITVIFKDRTQLDEVICEYPVGHKRRREEGIPLLMNKFITNLARVYDKNKQEQILTAIKDQTRFINLPVDEFMDMLHMG